MKKIIALLLCIFCLMSLFACKSAEKNEEIKKTLDKDIPNSYTGDIDVEQKIELGELNIVIKEKTFYINDVKFTFDSFKGKEKLNFNFENGLLDVYVKEGVLQKCVYTSMDLTEEIHYDIQGKSTRSIRYVYDDYGNAIMVSSYDGEGKLTGFYEAAYKDFKMSEKREYNASMDLIQVVKYYYSEKGELEKEAIYSSDLKLQKIIEH